MKEMKEIFLTRESEKRIDLVKIETDGEVLPTRRSTADTSMEVTYSLFNEGGILDSQTSDTQFFGFSQSAAVSNDGSPIRKKMFRPSVSPAKSQTPKFVMPSTNASWLPMKQPELAKPSQGKWSTKQLSVKQEEGAQTLVKRREEPSCKTKDTEDSDGTITTKELGVSVEDDDEEWESRVSEGLQELESARLNVQLLESVVHKELRLARERVEEIEMELNGLLTSRFARMKTISKAFRAALNVQGSMSPGRRANSRAPDAIEDEDPYHPSRESQMFRQLSEGYRAFYAESGSPTDL